MKLFSAVTDRFRQTLARTREAVQDGFDVYQPCTYVPNDINAPAYSSPRISNPCLSQGGLDQNIYGAQP